MTSTTNSTGGPRRRRTPAPAASPSPSTGTGTSSGRGAGTPAQSAGRVAALRRQARDQAQQLATDDGWRTWCRLVARLPTYGLDNTLLIAAARPQATQLAGYEAWQTLGRQVRRGEKGIAVLAPATGKAGPRVTHLWDVAQTDGAGPAPRDPALARVRQASAQQVWDRLVALAAAEGRPIERGLTPSGSLAGIDPGTGAIHVLPAVPVGKAAVEAAAVLLTARGRTPAVSRAAAAVWATAHGTAPDTLVDELTAPAGPAAAVRAAAEAVLADVRWLLTASTEPVTDVDRQRLVELHQRASVRLDVPAAQPATSPDVPATAVGAADAGVDGGLDLAALRGAHREALRFYRGQIPGSWAAAYLEERLPGVDPEAIAAGCAPADWTALTKHLRAAGYSDETIVASGLVSRARHGGLVDRFRNRLMLPIRDHDGTVVAFVGRARPGTEDEKTPKYLNSPTTALYRKGEVVYGLAEAAAHLPRKPMLVPVEGPLDALAVTYGTGGRAVGLACLGTAWTPHQVAAIHAAANLIRHNVVVATDPDAAGLKAARGLYELLTAHGADPRHAALPADSDPAALLASAGPVGLLDALTRGRPLSHTLIEDAAHLAAPDLDKGWAEQKVAATRAAVAITAALPPNHWDRDLAHIVDVTGIHPDTARHELTLAYVARPDTDTGIHHAVSTHAPRAPRPGVPRPPSTTTAAHPRPVVGTNTTPRR